MREQEPEPRIGLIDAERDRLLERGNGAPWLRWGPYLSERQWGTVREDYSCLLYTSPSPRDKRQSRMPSSA